VIPPERVLVVTALGAMAADEVQRLGFTAIERPATVGQVVAATVSLLAGISGVKLPEEKADHEAR
jgi:hypothetical protein